ncbi:Aspartate carbamoyltransferase [Leminorella richardii]|uniref:Aspartate carbamoyltransferase n=2 Tax=Leminorella richardii TaxID=158841 RepID=A0A2X4UBT9_9GAMM|nr:Aspartate carbamoyltransferase [Leminorella richardii]
MRGQHILGLEHMSPLDIERVLDTAAEMKKLVGRQKNKKLSVLRGKAIVNVFFENSTRTRSSFELAGKYLGADVINIAASTSSVAKGESLRDTLLTVQAMGIDAIVMRHSAEGAAQYATRYVDAVVINAGDGAHEHPTQGLLDLLTIRQHHGKIAGKKVAIIGDILHSRVARSNVWGLLKLGAEVHLGGPKTMIPKEMVDMGGHHPSPGGRRYRRCRRGERFTHSA